jgi:tRNA A-37 threonylcarbamoyl transferase component Bud32
MRILYLLPILLSVLFAGCSTTPVLEENKFIVVYTDLVIAQDTAISSGNDFNVVKDSVFRRHRITEKEYNETLDYYNQDPQRWDQFFNKVLKRLERLKKQHAKKT